MKKNIKLFLILIIALIVQSSIIPVFFPQASLPQLVLMLVIAGTAVLGFKRFFPLAIMAGLFSDLFFYSRVGTEVIVFSLAVYFVSFFSRRFLVENKFWGGIVLIFFVAILVVFNRFFIFYLNLASFDFSLNFKDVFRNLSGLGLGIFYNIILFFLCYWAIARTGKHKSTLEPANIKM